MTTPFFYSAIWQCVLRYITMTSQSESSNPVISILLWMLDARLSGQQWCQVREHISVVKSVYTWNSAWFSSLGQTIILLYSLFPFLKTDVHFPFLKVGQSLRGFVREALSLDRWEWHHYNGGHEWWQLSLNLGCQIPIYFTIHILEFLFIWAQWWHWDHKYVYWISTQSIISVEKNASLVVLEVRIIKINLLHPLGTI